MVGLPVELGPLHRWPTAFRADPVAHLLVIGPKLVACLRIRISNITMGVDANGLDLLAELAQGLKIEVDIRSEAIGNAANDREHQWHPVFRRTDHRFRTSSHSDPGLETPGFDRRKHPLVCQGGTRCALPRDWPLFEQGAKRSSFSSNSFSY